MNVKKLLSLRFYLPRSKEYAKMIQKDYEFNAAFRGCEILPQEFLNGREWKFIKAYRKIQCNQDNLWKHIYRKKLHKVMLETGIDVEGNMSIGPGLIIGHWGRVVINGQTNFGSQFFLTHGVTIGRDIRGKRAGVPTFGDRVCIRANSTVVGKVYIGNDVLIAPNTFVNFDVPSHSVVVGNPASIHHRDNATEGHIPNMNW